MIDSGEIIRTN